MSIPDKLQKDLFKPFIVEHDVFEKFLGAIEILMPSVSVKSTKRYSAFYLAASPLVYIEPLTDVIKLGYFRDHIRQYYQFHSEAFIPFAQWNTAHGGLVGYEVSGFDDSIRQKLAIAGMLIITSYQIRTGWPLHHQ